MWTNYSVTIILCYYTIVKLSRYLLKSVLLIILGIWFVYSKTPLPEFMFVIFYIVSNKDAQIVVKLSKYFHSHY